MKYRRHTRDTWMMLWMLDVRQLSEYVAQPSGRLVDL